MEALVITALIGLFLFLGYKYQQSQFTKQVDRLIYEASVSQNALEFKIQLMQDKVNAYDKVQIELEFARQSIKDAVPLELHLSELERAQFTIGVTENELVTVKAELDKSKGKQISERVRLGLVSENIAPFLSDFPYESGRVRGLFNPIDLLVFNDDEIIFVEVKSGEAKLSEKQRNIKRLIQEGKVRFEEHRIGDKGYTIK